MRFMIIDTCEIIMNTHVRSSILLVAEKSIKHPLLYNKRKILNLYEITSQDKLNDFMRSPRHIIIHISFYVKKIKLSVANSNLKKRRNNF